MLREDVGLEVDAVANVEVAKRRVIARVRDDRDGERLAVDRVDRQRDAGDRDRALLDDVLEERGHGANHEYEIGSEVALRSELAGAVDVSRDPVATEPVAELHRALEVDALSDAQRTECRALQRLETGE